MQHSPKQLNSFAPPSEWPKDDKISAESRSLGNAAFAQKNLNAAKVHYDNALRYAVESSQCQVLAYGNRSAVLFETRKYQDAINDIQRALRSRPTDANLKAKLSSRLENAEKSLDTEERNNGSLLTDSGRCQALAGGTHKTCRNLSALVKIAHSDDKGRHLVASQRIPPGSLIMRESPYSQMVVQPLTRHVCAECVKTLPGSWLPCKSCSNENIKFCSETCRDNAWCTWHACECGYDAEPTEKMASDREKDDLQYSQIVRRTLYRAGPSTLLKFDTNNNNNKTATDTSEIDFDPKYGLEADVSYGDNFESLVNLVGCSNSTKDCLVQRDYVAKVISPTFMEHNDWPAAYDHSRKLNLLHRLFNRLLAAAYANAHSILPLWRRDNNEALSRALDSVQGGSVARGFYPTHSLMNHSCAPNVCAVYDGKVVEIRVIRELTAGDELTFCYGPRFGSDARATRQERLSYQYQFTCTCCACSDKSYADIEAEMSALKCQSCISNCKKCPENGPAIIDDSAETARCRCCGQEQSFSQEKLDRQVDVYEKLLPNLIERAKTEQQEQNTTTESGALQQIQRSLAGLEMVFYTDNSRLHELRTRTAKLLTTVDPALSVAIQQKTLNTIERYFGNRSEEYTLSLAELVLTYSQIEGDIDRWMKLSKQLIDLITKLYGPDLARQVFAMKYGQFGLDYFDGVAVMFVKH